MKEREGKEKECKKSWRREGERGRKKKETMLPLFYYFIESGNQRRKVAPLSVSINEKEIKTIKIKVDR